MQQINIHTSMIIVIFACWYFIFIARKTSRQDLDIYDFVMLSMVATIPFTVALFPNFAFYLAGISGVEFPFVLMVGILFAILFIFNHRLTSKIHRLEKDNRLLIQEVSLLKATKTNRLVFHPATEDLPKGDSIGK